MDKRETTRLFRLLGNLYPSAPEFSQEESMLAWQLVLEPFAYDDVKAAAVEWARSGEKREYPPRVSELSAKLTPVSVPEQSAEDRNAWMDDVMSRQKCAGEMWQHEIEAGRAKDAADSLGGVSRYAREHGVSWEQAKAEIAPSAT